MKKVVLIFVIYCMGMQLLSQTRGYDLNFHQIFDNREYFSDYAFPQTIFGARIDASARFQLDSIHKFSTGFSYLYENGSSILGISPQLILNYEYTAEHLKMAFGSFARKGRVRLPEIFLNDTLNYYRPNIEGASIAYENEQVYIGGFIDWTSRVSESRRETFLIGLDSKLRFAGIFLNPSFLMYHNARSYNPLDSVHLQDNGMLSLILGYDLGDRDDLFSLSISSGFVSSYNRFRPQDFSWGRGVLSNIRLRYNIFGLNGVYYYGTPIEFEYGDPFYRAGNYGRIDLFVDPFMNPKIESKIGWNIHIVPGEGIHNSQQILISIAF